MACLSNWASNKIIDHIFKNTAWSAPSNLYVALLSTACVSSDTGVTISGGGGTGVEISGGSYARTAVNPSTTANWNTTQGTATAPSTGTTQQTQNNATITFPTATGSWSAPVVGFAICDAATNGNIVCFGTDSVSKTITASDVFSYNATNLSILLS